MVHSIRAFQRIPASLDEVWKLFSKASNLQKITPDNLSFNIISKYNEEEIYAGQIIEYTLKPLLGIKLYWMTEITHVDPLKYFVDEQRYGPYSMWHHQHHFKEIDGGVEMIDLVHYKNPLGFIGELANGIIVKKQLREIFTYRHKKVSEMLGGWKDDVVDVVIS